MIIKWFWSSIMVVLVRSRGNNGIGNILLFLGAPYEDDVIQIKLDGDFRNTVRAAIFSIRGCFCQQPLDRRESGKHHKYQSVKYNGMYLREGRQMTLKILILRQYKQVRFVIPLSVLRDWKEGEMNEEDAGIYRMQGYHYVQHLVVCRLILVSRSLALEGLTPSYDPILAAVPALLFSSFP